MTSWHTNGYRIHVPHSAMRHIPPANPLVSPKFTVKLAYYETCAKQSPQGWLSNRNDNDEVVAGGLILDERIYLSSPDGGELEQENVQRVLASYRVTPLCLEVDASEGEAGTHSQVQYAGALSSGTGALGVGLLVLGVRPADMVPTATMTFAATANGIKHMRAVPYCVDCDARGTTDPNLLQNTLEELTEQGRHVGVPAPFDPGVAGWKPEELPAAPAVHNTETMSVGKPMHLQPLFDAEPATTNGTSEAPFATGPTLPSCSALTEKQQKLIMQETQVSLHEAKRSYV